VSTAACVQRTTCNKRESPTSPRAQRMGGRPSNPLGPSDAETSRRPYPSVTAPPLTQIISNARGRFPQLEMVNSPRSPTKQRGGDKTQHVDTVVERLEGVSYSFSSRFLSSTLFFFRWVSMKQRTRQCARWLRRISLVTGQP